MKNNYNSVVIVNINSAIFVGKVSTAFQLSFGTCFQIMGSFISLHERSSTWLNYILSVRHLRALIRVLCQSRAFFALFLKTPIVVQSLNYPKFENITVCRVFIKVALHVEIEKPC